MEKLEFGKRLVEVRKAKGLTQSDVAEMCNINIRTIQRIESAIVKPRAHTIKIITESLGFNFYNLSDTGYDIIVGRQKSKVRDHTFLWYLKDLFNLKTYPMRKISILSSSVILIVLLSSNLIKTEAQTAVNERPNNLTIILNEDSSIQRLEASIDRATTLDSLVKLRNDLHEVGITIHYHKMEFDIHNLLVTLQCQVICNDGFSGSFGMEGLTANNPKRFGFYRDYSPGAARPFGTGVLEY